MLSTLKSLSIDGIALKQLSVNGVLAWTMPPSYTNWVPLSIDTDGSIFNGTGYQEDVRLSSSGALKTKVNSVATGFIPAKGGDTIRIANVNWSSQVDVPNNIINSLNYINAYDSAFTHIGARTGSGTIYGTAIAESVTFEGEMGIVKLAALDNIAYIRVSSCGDNTKQELGSEMIVTVNEEITE